MPIARFQMPDGRIARFEVPEGTTPEQAQGIFDKFLTDNRVQERSAALVKEMDPGEDPGLSKGVMEKYRHQGRVFRRALYGAERAWDEAAMGLKQLAPKWMGGGLSPQEEEDLRVRREAEKQIPGSTWSHMAGDIAITAPVAAATGGLVGLGRAASPVVAKVLPNAVARYLIAAGTGGAVAAQKPVIESEGEDRAENAKSGALWGMAGQAVGDAAGKTIRGIAQKSDNLKHLSDKVKDALSLGQTVDRNTLTGKVLATTEEVAQSVPLAGRIIAGARDRGRNAWRDDLVQQVTPEGFSPAGTNTRERLSSIYGELQKRYKETLAGHSVQPSPLFEKAIDAVATDPKRGMTEAQRQEVRNLVRGFYDSMFEAPTATGATKAGKILGVDGKPLIAATPGTAPIPAADASVAKNLEAFLTAKASQYNMSPAPGASDMAKAFRDIERAWTVAYRQQLPMETRQALVPLDKLYAPYKTVEKAAQSVSNDFGDFTPAQFLNAVKSRSNKPAFGRGEGMLQDNAQTARELLTDRVANSGTVDRGLAAGALVGAVALDPKVTALTLGTAVPAMATRSGRNFMVGDTKFQQLLQQLRADEAAQALGAPAGTAFDSQSRY